MDQLDSTAFIPDRQKGEHLKLEDRCSISIFKRLDYLLRKIADVLNCTGSLEWFTDQVLEKKWSFDVPEA